MIWFPKLHKKGLLFINYVEIIGQSHDLLIKPNILTIYSKHTRVHLKVFVLEKFRKKLWINK